MPQIHCEPKETHQNVFFVISSTKTDRFR